MRSRTWQNDVVLLVVVVPELLFFSSELPQPRTASAGLRLLIAFVLALPTLAYIAFRLLGLFRRRGRHSGPFAFTGLSVSMILCLFVSGLPLFTTRRGLLILAAFVLYFGWNVVHAPDRHDDASDWTTRHERHQFLRGVGWHFLVTAIGLAAVAVLGLDDTWTAICTVTLVLGLPLAGSPVATDEIYRFLRAALLKVEADRPYRGPRQWHEGRFTYTDENEGDIRRFQGREAVICEGGPVYRLEYNGGMLK